MPRYTSTVDSSTGLVEGQAGVTVLLINEMHLIFGTYVDFLYYFFPLKNRLIAFLYSLLQLISKLRINSPIPVIDWYGDLDLPGQVALDDGRNFTSAHLMATTEEAYESAAARAVSALQTERSLRSVIGRTMFFYFLTMQLLERYLQVKTRHFSNEYLISIWIVFLFWVNK